MERKHASAATTRTWAEHIDELLDEALKDTFPASDPIAVAVEQPDGERK